MIFSRQGLITQLMSKAKYRKFRLYSSTLRRYLTYSELSKVVISPLIDYTFGYYNGVPVMCAKIPVSQSVSISYDVGYGGIQEKATISYVENYSQEPYEVTLSIGSIDSPDITITLNRKEVNSQTRPLQYTYRGGATIPSEYQPSVGNLTIRLSVYDNRGERIVTLVSSFLINKDTSHNNTSLAITTVSNYTPAMANVESIECDSSEPHKAVYEAWVGKKITLVNNISRN